MKRNLVIAISGLVFGLMLGIVLNTVMPPSNAYAAEWSSWNAPKQATFYTDLGCTASGKIINSSSKYVAVDMSRVVSKAKWKKMSAKDKRRFFYYGEKLQIQHLTKKKKPVTVVVADCGSFRGAGQYFSAKKNSKTRKLYPAYWKNRDKSYKWYSRSFDLTNSARIAVGITWGEGVGMVRWRYAK